MIRLIQSGLDDLSTQFTLSARECPNLTQSVRLHVSRRDALPRRIGHLDNSW